MGKNVYLQKVSDRLKADNVDISAQELSGLITYSTASNSSSINTVITTKDAERSLKIAQAINAVTAEHLGSIYDKIKVETQQIPTLATAPSSPNILFIYICRLCGRRRCYHSCYIVLHLYQYPRK